MFKYFILQNLSASIVRYVKIDFKFVFIFRTLSSLN